MTGWADMHHDLDQFDLPLWEQIKSWFTYYWWPTKRWVPKIQMRWYEHRYGPMPPLSKDRIAQHFGWAPGIPPCADGPLCLAHGWVPCPDNAITDDDPDPCT